MLWTSDWARTQPEYLADDQAVFLRQGRNRYHGGSKWWGRILFAFSFASRPTPRQYPASQSVSVWEIANYYQKSCPDCGASRCAFCRTEKVRVQATLKTRNTIRTLWNEHQECLPRWYRISRQGGIFDYDIAGKLSTAYHIYIGIGRIYGLKVGSRAASCCFLKDCDFCMACGGFHTSWDPTSRKC